MVEKQSKGQDGGDRTDPRERSLISGISACVIDKTRMDKAFTKRREEVRYNYAVRLALETGGLFATKAKRRIQLTIDARNRRATDILREYVELLMANGEISCLLSLASKDSSASPQLQAADFVIGSIYTAYAHGDWKYVNALRKGGVYIEVRLLKSRTPAPEASLSARIHGRGNSGLTLAMPYDTAWRTSAATHELSWHAHSTSNAESASCRRFRCASRCRPRCGRRAPGGSRACGRRYACLRPIPDRRRRRDGATGGRFPPPG